MIFLNWVELEVGTYPTFSLAQQQLEEKLQMKFLHFTWGFT
jgi:hypothetical protein